jgi:ABC-type polysaccharide/polyol phosphate export permease
MTVYLSSIWQSRYFWLSLVSVDLRTRYRGSVLGLGWSLVHPLAMTLILCVVFHKLFRLDLRDFAPYLLCGLAFWNYLSLVILQGCSCLQQGESYIRQFPAPLAIYPLRTMLGATFHFLVTLAIVVILTAVVRGIPRWMPLTSLPLSVVLMMLAGWSLAVIFGFLNVYFPDLRHLTEVGLQLAFYLTPIIYPATMLRERSIGLIIDLNPLSAMVDLLRTPILDGRFPAGDTLAIAGGTTAVLTAAAILILIRLEQRLIYHL